MFKEAASVLIVLDDTLFLTWEGEREKAVINSENGLMIVYNSLATFEDFLLESQFSERILHVIFRRRFGFVWIRQYLAEFKYRSTVFALGVTFLPVSRNPKSFVWAAFWARFQGIGECFDFFKTQFFFPNGLTPCFIYVLCTTLSEQKEA